MNQWDVQISRESLRGRTFLLGNKRAFSLSLPVAAGITDALLHPHKWFGAYLYGRKFLEAQLVRVCGRREQVLGSALQTGFTMTLTSARREYQIEGHRCTEEYFVPDGIQGFACTLTGSAHFAVEPEFDIRFYRALNLDVDSYEIEEIEGGALIWNALPQGIYDDISETFLPNDGTDSVLAFAAVQIIGDDTWVEILDTKRRARQKYFRKDFQRWRYLAESAPEHAIHDHAPLSDRNMSYVYAPIRLHVQGHGTIVYGFGGTREEALEQLAALRDNLIGYQAQKWETAGELISRAHFQTQDERIDRAYTQVLTRLMDTLVARFAVAEDTVLEGPATMILAGNQYFHDSWKRDENIALGFLLTLGFYDLAREVIRDTWQLQDETTGRLPQRIRAGEAPPYHSSDGTLWALWRLYQYWRTSGDESLLYEKLSMVQLFFRRSVERSVNGMLPSGRTHAPDYLWETWMDTPHTPRDGFPVEIQMLWIANLRIYRPLVKQLDPELECAMEQAETAAWRELQRFNVRGVPADSMDLDGIVRDLITPNPYFCFGVGLDLGPEVERAMRDVGRRQLAGRQGIITLAPQDWDRVFSPEFLSNRRHVRGRRMQSIGKFNYHRGVEWNWLSQFFVQAELKYGDPDAAFQRYLRPQVDAALDRAGVGGISELFDLSGTRGPEFQSWSMAGFLEAMHAFAGVQIDVPSGKIVVAPQIPDSWPEIAVRKWYGAVPFDLRYSGDRDTRALKIEFPWGEKPQASLEVVLVLPPRQAADSVSVRLDQIDQIPEYVAQAIPGCSSTRLRFTVPAHASIEVAVGMKRAPNRLPLTA